MNNPENYPTWLVPLEIAIELKEIGYKEDCYFEFSKDNGLTLETLERESSIIGIDDLLFGTNECWQNISVPTWTEVFAWFRARGLHHTIRYLLAHKLYFYAINETYYLKNKGSGIYDTYEEAQKECVKALIKTYKTMKK